MSRTDGGLRQMFRQRLPQVHWQSIEVPAIARGVPDCNGCCRGVEFWVENKVTKGWTIGLRPEQAAWLMRRARAGGHTRVAVRRRKAGVDELWVFDGKDAGKLIRSNNLRDESLPLLGVWTDGPTHWQWSEVLSAFLSCQ